MHKLQQIFFQKKILFVAGGLGTAPVYPQVKWLHEHGVDVDVIMGSRNKDLLFYERNQEIEQAIKDLDIDEDASDN